MSWFERYGIVGIYYVILIAGILIAGMQNAGKLSADDFNNLSSIAIAIGGGVSVSAGYLITIFSQYIYYYWLCESYQVHKTVWKNIPIFKNYKNCCNEKSIETRLAIIQRLIVLPNDNYNIEQIRWFQEYNTKRWDVLVISFSVMIATPLAWLTALLILFINNICFKLDFRMFIIFIISFAVIIISNCSRN